MRRGLDPGGDEGQRALPATSLVQEEEAHDRFSFPPSGISRRRCAPGRAGLKARAHTHQQAARAPGPHTAGTEAVSVDRMHIHIVSVARQASWNGISRDNRGNTCFSGRWLWPRVTQKLPRQACGWALNPGAGRGPGEHRRGGQGLSWGQQGPWRPQTARSEVECFQSSLIKGYLTTWDRKQKDIP